jgi:hypothetical protein
MRYPLFLLAMLIASLAQPAVASAKWERPNRREREEVRQTVQRAIEKVKAPATVPPWRGFILDVF